MVRLAMWLCSLIFFRLLADSVAAEPVSARIERIERGLRPAIVIDGTDTEKSNLTDRMAFYKIPGVSIAVIDQGAIAWARGYGLREAATPHRVTAETLFQAASISKPIAALTALRLVEQGLMDLDDDVNRKLQSWKLPENELTKEHKVTLRMLLSHRAGLTDYAGFHSTAPNEAMPTLQAILETGKWTPAPIRVGLQPGSRFAYSGGGYCLMEQMMEDVSSKKFAALADELVLKPLKMESSSFDQSSMSQRAHRAAIGHQFNVKKLPQGWNRYSVTSAAGLWTTPSDLAKFAIELQKVGSGARTSVVSSHMLTEMLSAQGPPHEHDAKVIARKEGIREQSTLAWGLGIGLVGRSPTRFFHTGSNPGYQCELQAYVHSGQGAVVMTNGDQGWRLAREILWAIASEYEWPDYEYGPEIQQIAKLSHQELDNFVGRYRISFAHPGELTLRISRQGEALSAQILPYAGEVRLYPQSNDSCFTIEDAMALKFEKDDTGGFNHIVCDLGWTARRLRE